MVWHALWTPIMLATCCIHFKTYHIQLNMIIISFLLFIPYYFPWLNTKWLKDFCLLLEIHYTKRKCPLSFALTKVATVNHLMQSSSGIFLVHVLTYMYPKIEIISFILCYNFLFSCFPSVYLKLLEGKDLNSINYLFHTLNIYYVFVATRYKNE